MQKFPLLTVLLASLVILFSLLSLGKVLPNPSMLYLDSGLFQGVSPWGPLTYWLFVDKAPSLILALLPLFLFGPSVESLVSRRKFALIFFGGVILASIVFAVGFASLGTVKAANGALCGGVSLAGAAFVLSLAGLLPQSNAGQLPIWVLSLLFLGGVCWTSAFVSEGITENVLFRSSGFLVGVFVVMPGALSGYRAQKTQRATHIEQSEES